MRCNKLFQKLNLKFIVYEFPIFKGYWKTLRNDDQIYTMTHQSYSIFNNFSVQVELPLIIREEMMKNELFLNSFIEILIESHSYI